MSVFLINKLMHVAMWQLITMNERGDETKENARCRRGMRAQFSRSPSLPTCYTGGKAGKVPASSGAVCAAGGSSLYRKTNWKISITTLFQRVPTQCNVCRDCGQTSHTVFCGDLGCDPLVATGCCLPVLAFLMLADTDSIEGKLIIRSYLDLLLHVRNFPLWLLPVSIKHR